MTWHFYRVADGRFTGRTYDGPAAYLAENIPDGCAAASGVTDWRQKRVDNRGELVDCEPEPPPLSVVRAETMAQIRALESQQPRLLRSLALDPTDAEARARLLVIEALIEELRPQLR
jgi:hypothetical protein